MKNLTATVWVAVEDFNCFLQFYAIIQDLPNLECDYTFRSKDIRMYGEKMMLDCVQINIPMLEYLKWRAYYMKNL